MILAVLFCFVLKKMNHFIFFTNPERPRETKREYLHVSSEMVRMFQST